VQQVNKEWDCNKETTDAYVLEARKLENKFSSLEVHHVLREHNVGADTLSKLGLTRAQVPPGVFIQLLKQPSITSCSQVTIDAGPQQPDREVMVLQEDWREAFIDFIRDQKLPVGIDARSAEAARVLRRSKGFVLVNSKLYQRGAQSGVLMKCVTKEEGYVILREIHEGVCGNHAASRTLVGKAYRAGFWWPTAVSDAEDLMRRCQNCQFFGKQTHVPAHSLITIPLSWPFACWSLDMIGPFTMAPGDFTHVLMAIDKFTKWIENSKKGGKWIHELPHVIWGLRTQSSKAIGQTPFFLVYESEAILPANIMWKSSRVEM
jgi:hypothetical protein